MAQDLFDRSPAGLPHTTSKRQTEPEALTKKARNGRFKLMAALLAVALFFIVPEVLARLFHHTDQTGYRAIKLGGDRNSAQLFAREAEITGRCAGTRRSGSSGSTRSPMHTASGSTEANSDAWPARISDLADQQSSLASGLMCTLSRSAFCHWTAARPRSHEEPENPTHYADGSVPRGRNDEMAANLEAVIALAERHSARVLMLLPLRAPANLHFPRRNRNAEIDKNRALGDRISAEIHKKNVEVATKLADDALAKDSSHICLHLLAVAARDWDRARSRRSAGSHRARTGVRTPPLPDRPRGTYRKR